MLTKREYCVIDVGNNMNITAKHWQIATQHSQNTCHLYSFTLPVMKQSRGCFWQPVFCFFSVLSFPTGSWTQHTIHITTKKFSCAFNSWCWCASLDGWKQVAIYSEAHRCKCYKHCMDCKVHTRTRCLQKKREVFCKLNFPVVEGLSPFHTNKQCPLPSNMGLGQGKLKCHTS